MRSALSYTAANQLYFSITPTAAAGTYDYNWHWYDGDGRRVISKVDQASLVVGGPGPNAASGSRNYYMYDGDDVAVVLTRMGTTWFVRQRILSGGLDRPLATRISPLGTATQNLAFIADRQGTTLAAVRPDGLRDETVAYFGRNVFGTLEGASGSGSSTNAETGFTGASTPNQTGGFTYLRNRWYDPQSGRFLTQDPIGLAGGVNLYAYAGNNPVSFSDPFGLCQQKQKGNSTQSEAVSACEKFARYVEKLAAQTKRKSQFIRALGQNIAGFPGGTATLKPGPSSVSFGESGFDKRYVDGDGHPARHFTANLVVGFQLGGDVSRAAAVVREIPGFGLLGGCTGAACSVPDVRLGAKGAEAGEQLRTGALNPGDLGDWVREEL